MKLGLDYEPLKNFSAMFVAYLWVKRIRMLVFRIAVLAFAVFVGFSIVSYFAALDKAIQNNTAGPELGDFYFACGEGAVMQACPTVNVNIGLVIIVLYMTYLIPFIWMAVKWALFARKNHFQPIRDRKRAQKIIKVPSFKKRLSYAPVAPVTGEIGGVRLTFFPRMYKEGGLLRWRERKMDIILMLELPKNLPHIVVNARANEAARLSNKSVRLKNEVKFQFEGVSGLNYDGFATKGDELAAFQVFTPNVLETLYDLLPSTDVEIYGNRLWFMERNVILDNTAAEALFEGAFALYAKITRNIATMRTDIQ